MKSNVPLKRFRCSLILASSIVFLIIALGSLFSIYVEHKLEANILTLHGKISSIQVNLLYRSIKVNDLEWSSGPDSMNLNPHFLHLRSVTAEGINLYELLVHKTVQINSITIDSGAIQYSRTIKRSRHKIRDLEFKHFLFKKVSLNKIKTQIKTDTTTSFSALLNGHLNEFHITIDSLHTLRYSIKGVDALIEHLNISQAEGMYRGTIARIHINTDEERFVIDSAVLIPNFGKFEFAHQRGEQIGRMNLTIPQVIIEGFQFDKLMDSSFVASSIRISSFDLYSFKDKRIPFVRKHIIPLPMESFINLPFLVKVDLISIEDSHISIEEFPEQGNVSGFVTFDHINATIANLNNRRRGNDPSSAQLDVTAQLLNAGSIKALFDFPLDGSPEYSVRGSISDMDFATLNPLLSALSNVRVESGYLNALTFQFKYTEFVSNGILNIDYMDLQLMSLDKNHHAIDGFRTFLMNAFVKNERSQSPSTKVQTAIIQIERDRKRYMPNVWIKSILDGLKSSVLGKTKVKKE